jgi:hypothetical protein
MSCPTARIDLDYAAAVADSFLDLGEAYALKGDAESALRCNYLAAHILQRQNRDLVSPRLEANLQRLAAAVPSSTVPRVPPRDKNGEQQVWLHVFSEVCAYGGHTGIAIRWMKSDKSGRIHNVAILAHSSPVPEDLLEACRGTGGAVFVADPEDPFLRRASWLRDLAYRTASHVLLHVHMDDVIACAAFGIDGGPPVLFMNHAAHVFWVGISIADLVLNMRGSQLENEWTQILRGAPRCSTLPIPLFEGAAHGSERRQPAGDKNKAKERLGIPKDAILILTVGTGYKYIASNGLDFIGTCEEILKSVPEAFIIAVGPEADQTWSSAARRTSGRLKTVGTLRRPEVSVYHEAADILIEGFPFGTTTALLEAGLCGLPVVLAPASCPPPYGTDGVALDDILQRPRSVEDYKAAVVSFARSRAERLYWGEAMRETIRKHHTGLGWNRYLEATIEALPLEHKVHSSITSIRTPDAIHEYWSEFVRKWPRGPKEWLEDAFIEAFSLGVRPHLSRRLLNTCKQARVVRRRGTIPIPVLVLLCNILLPRLPIGRAAVLFRACASLFREHLMRRMKRKICFVCSRHGTPKAT